MRQRERLVPRARGVVLEIGIGTGLNLPFYDAGRVTKVYGLDPSPAMARRAADVARTVDVDVELIGLPGEEIPLESGSVDTVLTTYTLCSVSDTQRTLGQMARVLRPAGRLLFCEHGASPDESVRRWQSRLTPLWSRIGGGCRLDRDMPALIAAGGFEILELEAGYVPGWRPGSYTFGGSARVA